MVRVGVGVGVVVRVGVGVGVRAGVGVGVEHEAVLPVWWDLQLAQPPLDLGHVVRGEVLLETRVQLLDDLLGVGLR